ncbi:hypothetical protein [Sporosarcina sp. 6E9]|uniref:hypothetical protein n=1 Tax=Sporosarcina sp. 6E9 TaxID=2819235 RepID=UPI001B3112A8|nr:hypothetical protein [Sporosarcina sp. 6E9]
MKLFTQALRKPNKRDGSVIFLLFISLGIYRGIVLIFMLFEKLGLNTFGVLLILTGLFVDIIFT